MLSFILFTLVKYIVDFYNHCIFLSLKYIFCVFKCIYFTSVTLPLTLNKEVEMGGKMAKWQRRPG
jgi:hypothetical protein